MAAKAASEVEFKCCICGQPATHAARDLFDVTNPGDRFERYTPGIYKFGCDLHQVDSRIISFRQFDDNSLAR